MPAPLISRLPNRAHSHRPGAVGRTRIGARLGRVDAETFGCVRECAVRMALDDGSIAADRWTIIGHNCRISIEFGIAPEIGGDAGAFAARS